MTGTIYKLILEDEATGKKIATRFTSEWLKHIILNTDEDVLERLGWMVKDLLQKLKKDDEE